MDLREDLLKKLEESLKRVKEARERQNEAMGRLYARQIHRGEITLDDTIPYIWYSIIKAKPLRFVTNLEYISTFKIAKYEYAIASVKTILAQFKNLKKEEKIETADAPV